MSTIDVAADITGPRPSAATGRGHLLRSEVRRLAHRRLVRAIVLLALLGLLAGVAVTFFTHSKDVAGARAEATATAARENANQRQWQAQCENDSSIPDADKQSGACGPAEPAPVEAFYRDPRLRADVGLPAAVIGVAIGGSLVAALIGATAVGADWASRAIVTLLTWEPRRLRLLGTRFAAIGLAIAALAVVAQGIAFGLVALTVTLRGTWQASPPPAVDAYYSQPSSSLIGPDHFWRDMVSLEVRAVVLMALVAILAAAVTTLTRHTGGLLGAAFGWFAVVENAVRILFYDRGWGRWLMTENIAAFVVPGGQNVYRQARGPGGEATDATIHLSNLDGLLYLGAITAAFVVLAAVLLRRRDL